MPSTTSGAILTALKARINALTPATKASEDDIYRAEVGLRSTFAGSRLVMLSCQPGRRVQGGRTCSDWETVIEIAALYLDNPGIYEIACADAEQICNELYDWVASNDGQNLGLLRVDPELATIEGAEGELQVIRSVRFLYRGLP